MKRTMAALAVAIAAVGCWTGGGGDTTPVTSPVPPLPTETRDAAPVAKDKPSAAEGCDEVSCVLDNYERACCEQFRKGPRPRATTPPPGMQTSLDRTMITNGIAGVKAQIAACGQLQPNVHGTVKASVKVDPSGVVTSVTIAATPDAALGNCVASEMQRARFDATTQGGSFSYPFVF